MEDCLNPLNQVKTFGLDKPITYNSDGKIVLIP